VKGNPRVPIAVDLTLLTQLCEKTWGRTVEPRAAAYFARLMERQIKGFTPYLNGRNVVTLESVWEAASRYWE